MSDRSSVKHQENDGNTDTLHRKNVRPKYVRPNKRPPTTVNKKIYFDQVANLLYMSVCLS